MVKSPVEGSTAALIRLETSVTFSNFIRPICLPDKLDQSKMVSANKNHRESSLQVPRSEQLVKRNEKRSNKIIENRQYFIAPTTVYHEEGDEIKNEFSAEFTDNSDKIPRAEASINQAMPIHEAQSQQPQWTNCNTLGWSRQRDHIQRVQLKIIDMAACENVSIATVNSICAETAYQKQDCSEEEFAGSPVMCLLADGKQWALVGVASWRIACAQSGIERPRMYDKITSNSAWIRYTINSA